MNLPSVTCKCGKQIYDSQLDALNEIKLRNRAGNKRKLTKAYRCSDTNNWHITSKDSRVHKMKSFIRQSNYELKNYALNMYKIYKYEQKIYNQQLNI